MYLQVNLQMRSHISFTSDFAADVPTRNNVWKSNVFLTILLYQQQSLITEVIELEDKIR